MGCLSKAIPIIVIFLLTFSNAFAQNNSKPLALKECVQIAMDNSSKIIIAKRAVVISELEVKDVMAGYFPKLDATADYKVNDTDHYDTKLSLTEIFYDNGKTSAQTKQAKARLESARADFQKIRAEIILSVTKNYYETLKAQKMIQVKDEGLKQAQTHLDLAKARYNTGVAPKSDILKAEVEAASSEGDLIFAENTLSLTQADLNNCLGIDLDTPLLILSDDRLENIEGVCALTIDDCLACALKNRPEIKKADISLLINEIDLK
ncbi:MAG: TolC family protein, partial [Candidatus Desantisbacteria bacterium]